MVAGVLVANDHIVATNIYVVRNSVDVPPLDIVAADINIIVVSHDGFEVTMTSWPTNEFKLIIFKR